MGRTHPISSDCRGGCHQTDVCSHDTRLPSGKSPHADTDTHTHTDDGRKDGRMREVKKTIEIRMTSGVTINGVYTHQLLILFTKGC